MAWYRFLLADPRRKRLFTGLAVLWTIVILGLCFLPGNEIPDVRIPLADKWVHFIIFGCWAWLVLMARARASRKTLIIAAIAAALFGWLVEVLQGQLSFLGRTQDNMDALADAVGGVLGVAFFALMNRRSSVMGPQS